MNKGIKISSPGAVSVSSLKQGRNQQEILHVIFQQLQTGASCSCCRGISAAVFITWIISQKCFMGRDDTVEIRSAARLNYSRSTREHQLTLTILMAFFWLVLEFSFILCLIAIFCLSSSFLLLASYSLLVLPLSMNLWLGEKALKEGLAGVNGGQVCQLLHPNEAALSFTKPQLITLQAISKQDCLSESLISPSSFPHSQQHNDETCGI